MVVVTQKNKLLLKFKLMKDLQDSKQTEKGDILASFLAL